MIKSVGQWTSISWITGNCQQTDSNLKPVKIVYFSLYLPLFFDGLSETQHPYKTFARQGVQDLLSNGGDKIYAIIPQLIIPIKNALNTKNIEVMCTVLRIIQQLVNASDLIGPGLVPFYRQLLPVFNAYKIRNSE